MDIIKELKNVSFNRIAPFGSRAIGCAKEDSDCDYLVLVSHRPSSGDMAGTGFRPDTGDPMYGTYFSSWRKDDVNLIFTDSVGYFEATLEACEFCKKYKIYDKEDRCKVHKVFRDSFAINDSPYSIFT